MNNKILRLENPKPSDSFHVLPRTVDHTTATAEVFIGLVNGTYILVVSGKKPYLNMHVQLSPLTYVQQPDYWAIEVVGSIPGIGLPTIGAYSQSLQLDGIVGKFGIEVIWSDGTERISIPRKNM